MRNNPHKDFELTKARTDLKKLLKQIAKVRINNKSEFEYKGVDIRSSAILATSHDIKNSFKKDNLSYDKERGRDKLDVFITKVLQLGYSVGYETAYEKYNDFSELSKILKNEINR